MKYTTADILGPRYKKFVSERIQDKINLDEWRIDRVFRLNISNNTNYLQLIFEHDLLNINESPLNNAISIIRDIFLGSVIHFQKIGNSYISGPIKNSSFWIIIEDIDHENSWSRIK